MKTRMIAPVALAVLVAGGAMAAEPRGIQTYEFADSAVDVSIECLNEMVRFEGIIQVRTHMYETKNGPVHLVENWFIHQTATGLSSGREWIGEGVSPFQATQKVGQSIVAQWVTRIRYTPVEAGDPMFMYQNAFKVTVNANGELVMERAVDPPEEAYPCLGKK